MVPDLLCWLGDLLIGGMEELALHIPHLLSHLENQNIKKSSLEKESKTWCPNDRSKISYESSVSDANSELDSNQLRKQAKITHKKEKS